MDIFNKVGDALASLQVDASGKKPSHVDAVYGLLDKLAANQSTTSSSKEGYAAPATAAADQVTKMTMTSTLKVSAVLTAIFIVLSMTPVHNMLDKMFKSNLIKIGVVGVVFFVACFFVVKFMGVSKVKTA